MITSETEWVQFLYSIVETLVSYVFFCYTLKPKVKKRISAPLYALVIPLVVTIIEKHIPSSLRVAIVMSMVILGVIFLFGGAIKDKFIALVVYAFVSFTCDFFAFFCAGIVGVKSPRVYYHLMSLFMIAFSSLFMMIAYQLWKGFKDTYDKKWLASFALIPVAQMLLQGYIVVLLKRSGILAMKGTGVVFAADRKTAAIIVSLIFVTLIADLVFLHVSVKSATGFAERQRLDRLEAETKFNYEYYTGVGEDAREMRKFRHDINNILQTVNILLDEPDDQARVNAVNTVQALEKEINTPILKRYCTNSLVNAILGSSERKLGKLGIKCSFSAEIPEQLNVPELDICRVLTNLIDNASEALELMPQEDAREMSLNIQLIDDYIYIKSRNSFAEGAARKKDEKNHGMGTKIISQIAKKNLGEYNTERVGGIYTSTVTLKSK